MYESFIRPNPVSESFSGIGKSFSGADLFSHFHFQITVEPPRLIFFLSLGRGRSISKVPQTFKNVNQDPQGCPTIPHDHSMCLHHPVGAYLCVLSTTIFPYKSRKSKKKSTSVTPTPEKTSDSAFSSKVCSTKVKLEIRKTDWVMPRQRGGGLCPVLLYEPNHAKGQVRVTCK